MGLPNYEVYCMGPCYPKEFLGYRTDYTNYRRCVVGSGLSASEAYSNAVSAVNLSDPAFAARMPKKGKGIRKDQRLTQAQVEAGYHYYVGIRWERSK